MSSSKIVISLSQALGLAAIAPCVVVIFYLIFSIRNRQVIISVGYFLALISSLTLAFLLELPISIRLGLIKSLLLFGGTFEIPMSYLLVLQLLQGRNPPSRHFLILLLPILGSSAIVYASSLSEIVCSSLDICVPGRDWVRYYQIFSGALILMLLTFVIGRRYSWLHATNITSRHKYWVVISLIVVNVFSLALDLSHVAGYVDRGGRDIAQTIVRIGFIYLVLSSIFRVFHDTFIPKGLSATKQALLLQAGTIAKSIERLLEDDKIYKDMDLHRGKMADMLNLKEYQLSFVINATFKKSFTELVNEYRIREAKHLLLGSDQSVTAISFEIGFSSLTSFNRVFKQAVGVAPSEYRIKHKS